MEQAFAPCPEIFMKIKDKSTKSLLDSGSMCTLMNESYFQEYIEHCLQPSSSTYNNSHNLFHLKGVKEGHVPIVRHFKVDVEVGGQTVSKTDNVMYFVRLVKQASVDLVSDLFVCYDTQEF